LRTVAIALYSTQVGIERLCEQTNEGYALFTSHFSSSHFFTFHSFTHTHTHTHFIASRSKHFILLRLFGWSSRMRFQTLKANINMESGGGDDIV
jgi:hypothetical protein